MSRAVLIDHQTVVAFSGGRQMQTLLADLDSVLTQKTSVAVVPTEISRVVATTEDTLHKQLQEKLPEGSVYCFEKVDAAVFQVFSMAESILASLRACSHVGVVVPYGPLARDGQKIAVPSGTVRQDPGLITRAGRAFLGRTEEIEELTEDITIIDLIGDRRVITCAHGSEIRTVRALHPEDDLEREVTLTLQGVNMSSSRIVTHDRSISNRLSELGRDVQLVRVPPEAPSVALVALRKDPPLQFHLAAEMARSRRREAQQRLLRSVVGAALFLLVGLGLTGASVTRRLMAEAKLQDLRREQFQTTETHSRLFRERYAGMLTRNTFNLPQAWAELEFMMPPQLVVESVGVTQQSLTAMLKRRELDLDFRDPPVSLTDLEQAVERSASWRGAVVSPVMGAHELKYRLEKTR